MNQPNMAPHLESSSSTSSIQSMGGKKAIKTVKNDKSKGKGKSRNIMNEREISSQFEKQLNLGKYPNSNSTKKKQISLKHLLHYESYKESDEYKARQASKPKRAGRRSPRGSFNDHSPDRYKVALTGMGFINLNYKFVVDYKGNYKPQELDPNIPVTKDNIIRIIVPKGNACPICLSDEPVAPRMITSCGHIICLTCLLSLLDTEIPSFKKKENSAIVEKYKECPLCSSIIRKSDVKPVLINNIDERFETPKIGDEVIMTLMTRPYNKLFSVPRDIESVHYQIKNFPSVNLRDPDLSAYSRLFKGDLKYILDMYNEEKAQILKTYETEKLLYDESNKYVVMALDEIDKDIQHWSKHYNDQQDNEPIDSIVRNDEINSANSFFYYQTGFNTGVTYILSPLDIKVLKTHYNDDYSNLPSSVIAKVESIQYEELTPENSMKKYKYLSHLPLGTSIGFIQCNWSKNEYISEETWNHFQVDLTKRSKKTNQKFQREERDKKRAQNEEERRTKLFFEQENNNFHNSSNHRNNYVNEEEYYYYEPNGATGGLTIVDNRDLPALNPTKSDEYTETETSSAPEGYETTVWGTKIKKSESSPSATDEEDWDAEEMIRKAREEMDRTNISGKKKKKKKLILLSSTYH